MKDVSIEKKKISKKGIVAIAVAVVLLLTVLFGVIYYSTHENQVIAEVVYLFVDNEKPAVDGTDTIYRLELNDDYDNSDENAELFDAFQIRSIESNGKETIYHYDDTIESEGKEIGVDIVMALFLAEKMSLLNTVKIVAIVVIAVIVVVGLIFIWYRVWSKKEDEKTLAKRNKSPQKKKQ